MVYYNNYSVVGCENKEISHRFLRVLLAYSDALSLIYFRYQTEEKFSSKVSQIKRRLSPFELDSRDVTEWPGTKVRNDQGHLYRMITYQVNMNIVPILEEVDTLWDWDYPLFPMDPCFYKKGYAWFAVSTHERWNSLYLQETDSFPLASDLESIGVTLISRGKATAPELFYNQNYTLSSNQ